MCLPLLAAIPALASAAGAAGAASAAAGTAAVSASTLSALTFAASAASALAGFVGQRNQAKATTEMYGQQQDQAVRDADRQRVQQTEQDASEANQLETQAMKDRSHLDALIGEYGGGNTSSRLVSTQSIRQGQDRATLASNQSQRQQEISLGQAADVYSLRSKSASVPKPSFAGTALTIAGYGLQYGQRSNEIANPKPGAGVK